MENDKKYRIEKIKDYILTCPYLDKLADFGVNFLDRNSSSYSIEEVPGKTIINKNIDGSSERQLNFIFASVFNFNEELETQINNSGFYEDFSDWIEENNENEVFPKLKDGETPTSIEVVTSGYLYALIDGMKRAQYQIQCKLIYEKEER